MDFALDTTARELTERFIAKYARKAAPKPATAAPRVPVDGVVDTKRPLSATPSTPLGAVAGVVDRSPILSVA